MALAKDDGQLLVLLVQLVLVITEAFFELKKYYVNTSNHKMDLSNNLLHQNSLPQTAGLLGLG